MAKHVFHDLSEIGVLKNVLPYGGNGPEANGDNSEITSTKVKPSQQSAPSLYNDKQKKKKAAKKKNKAKRNARIIEKNIDQTSSAKRQEKKISIQNVIVSRTANNYQVASLMTRQYNSMEILESYSKYYQEYFGEEKFKKIHDLVAKIYEQERKNISFLFNAGGKYLFKVYSSHKHGEKFITQLMDEYKYIHNVFTETSYPLNRVVKCIVKSIDLNLPSGWQLELDSPCLLPQKEDVINFIATVNKKEDKSKDTTRIYTKALYRWAAELKDESYHKCGKDFRCNCCGKYFKAGQGYRIDMKEIYFCTECKREIFKPKHPGDRRYMKIIYTNMGHKR